MKKILAILLVLIFLGGGVAALYFFGSRFVEKEIQEDIILSIATTTKESAPFEKKIDFPAPNFSVKNINGDTVELKNLHEKMVVLTFWTTWNPMAVDQLGIFSSYYRKNKDKGEVFVLALNNQEDKSVVENFVRRKGDVMPVFLDEEGSVGERYKITTLPMTYFIDKNGRVKDIYIGPLSEDEVTEKVLKMTL